MADNTEVSDEITSSSGKPSGEQQSKSEQNDRSTTVDNVDNENVSSKTKTSNDRRRNRRKERRKRKREKPEIKREKTTEAGQQAIKILAAVVPHVVKTTHQLLEFFVRKECRVVVTRPPILHYSIQQTILAAFECIRRLDDLSITYNVLRDLLENLLFLHKRYLKLHTVEMGSFAIFIRKMTIVIGELGTSLERMSEVTVTDWQAVGDKLVSSIKINAGEKTVPFTEYIPTMEQFEKIRLLGYGGFGYVYKVFYIPADITCSMKLVPIERFHQSKHACADKLVASVIKSPYLIRFFVCFAASEAYITVMEYVKGVDVLAVVNETSFLPIDQVQIITGQLICAVEHLHLRGFIHRDVKVSNIMIRTTGHIKLFDYDTNKVCIGHFVKRIFKLYFFRTAHEFQDNETAGSVSYMAPEVIKIRPYGRSSDWWSVGVSIYKMCTGRVPFRGKTTDSLTKKIAKQPLAWPKVTKYPHSATSEAKEYVYKLLKKNPVSRLGSRIYSDIKTDRFLENFKLGQLWKYQKLVEIQNVAKLLQKAEQQDMSESVETSEEESELSTSTLKMKKLIKFESINDETDTRSHKEIYTFASVRFKKLVDRLKAMDNKKFKGCENALNPRTPPSPEMDYNKVEDVEESLLPPTQQLTEVEKQAQLSEKINIQINRNTRLGIFWSYGFTLQDIDGDGGLVYHMVNYIKPESAASRSELLLGDIVTSIDNTKIVGLPVKVVMANVVSANKGSSMTLTVFKNNPFRVVQTRKDVSTILGDCTQITLILSRVATPTRNTNAFGFSVYELKTWDETIKTFVRVHIVNCVDADIVIKEPRSVGMFVGDVIFEINDKPIENTSLAGVEAMIARVAGELLSIVLSPMSVLRRKELHETNITDLSTGEHQEGTIQAVSPSPSSSSLNN